MLFINGVFAGLIQEIWVMAVLDGIEGVETLVPGGTRECYWGRWVGQELHLIEEDQQDRSGQVVSPD